MSLDFVYAYANLVAVALSIPANKDKVAFSGMCKAYKAQPYVPKKIKVVTPEEEKENQGQQPEPQPLDDDEEAKTDALTQELEKLAGKVEKASFQPAEFEKDDDTNFHIEFINATANLRATNYQIANSDR